MARILILTSDIAEAAQIRRIKSLRSLGHEVTSAGFRRANMNPAFQPDWPHLHVCNIGNGGMGARCAALARACARLLPRCGRLGAPELILARNLDMLALAVALRPLLPGRPAIVYECLDIHGSLTAHGPAAAMLRRVERWLLRRIALLVTSSPGFLRSYFGPVQRHAGPTHLLENRLAGDELPARPRMRPDSPNGPSSPVRPDCPVGPDGPDGPARPPLVLGWVGSIRCAPSLALLADLARRMGPDLQIRISGAVHMHAVPDFPATLARHPNLIWTGAYRYPDDLAGIYAGCDLVWAQDLWQRGANSDWLLPNRIYEAGYFGCPAIAVDGTETARRIQRDGLGFTIPRPDASDLAGLLTGLDRAAIAAASSAILARPTGQFRENTGDLERMVQLALRGDIARAAPRAALPGPPADRGEAA
ncbi:MAG: glycosyltransferase [Pseudomonadota bacterium]